MRRFPVFLLLFGCSTGGAADAGVDATEDAPQNLCDLDAFFASGGHDAACPMASPKVCFQPSNCPNTGCKCTATAEGPRWRCMKDPNCPDGGADAGEDAGADAGVDASADAEGG